jgi:uncharacterized protein YggT (Ycf19 family)
MGKKQSLIGFGVLLLVYVILVFVALLYYPEPFSPLNKTLAQLGNPIVNPSGAIAYNIGIIVTSLPIVLIVTHSLTIGRKTMAKTFQKGNIYFYLTSTFFLLFAIFNILTAFIPLGNDDNLSALFSLFSFITFQLFTTISAAGIRGNANHTRWIPSMGFAVVLINILLFGMLYAGLVFSSLIMTVLFWAYILAFIYEVT